MSSNIRVQKICEYCGEEYIAKTTQTRYCSHTCNSRDYKARKRAEKVERSKTTTILIKSKPIRELKEKPYLKVKETATLLGCSPRTIYRLIDNGTIKASNLGERLTRIDSWQIHKLINDDK